MLGSEHLQCLKLHDGKISKIYCKSSSGSIKSVSLLMRIHRGKLLAWSEKMELMSWTSCVSSNWLWHPHVFLLSSLGSKKSRCCKEKPQNLWPNISMRFLSCLHVQHKSEYSCRCFSLEWMVLHPIGVKSLFRYSLRQRSKKRSWHLKNIGQIEYTQQQICTGANNATRPPSANI